MAGRGLVLSPPTKSTSHLIISFICRAPPLTKFPKYPSSSLPRHKFTLSYRFLCSCSIQQQHDTIEMEKYKESFSKRMSMAGLKPHHRIGLGVSGGPDSMALCVLAASWKTEGSNFDTKEHNNEFIDGILAIIVDHKLRTESKDEANLVSHRVKEMGIKSEIVSCEWLNGKPKHGHLQEAARDKRYEIFRNVCIKHKIGVLLIAHHSDDQAELFILRLSRGSGVLGLAGMAFTSQLFSKCRNFNCEALNSHGILLVRPFLDFSKEDMYKICIGNNQEWVEDPTNKNNSFTRNRIRMSLNNLSSPIFKSELLSVVNSCRKTRIYVDNICSNLLHQAVTIMPEGYAVIDVQILNPYEIEDLILSKFVSLVLQFISQRQRPVRGNAIKLLLDYFRKFPCKTCLTVSGSYLCPAPGSKGTKVLVCCSVNLPFKMEIFDTQKCVIFEEVEKIVANKFVPDLLDINFLDTLSSESVLTIAKSYNVLSDSTFKDIVSLQKSEIENFRGRIGNMSKDEILDKVDSSNNNNNNILYPGEIGYFMNRYLVTWDLRKSVTCDCGIVSNDTSAKVRLMMDSDWLYLGELTREKIMKNACGEYVKLSAEKGLLLLKCIPVNVRRSLPVLVNLKGQLLSIPSVSFEHCPCFKASAMFKPSTPLGGGHTSFM